MATAQVRASTDGSCKNFYYFFVPFKEGKELVNIYPFYGRNRHVHGLGFKLLHQIRAGSVLTPFSLLVPDGPGLVVIIYGSGIFL